MQLLTLFVGNMADEFQLCVFITVLEFMVFSVVALFNVVVGH
jgi:hypothetical protein